MVIAGLCGGLDRAGENRFGVTPYAFHDAACALLEHGEVTAAIEEERLNRIKHTNKCPLSALRFCLDHRGLNIADLDAVAFGVRESYLDDVLVDRYAQAPTIGRQRGRQFIQRLLEDEFGARVDPRRFVFVDHHLAHACSAYYPSGFSRALVLTLDGVGDGLSGTVYTAIDNRLDRRQAFPEQESLGFFYVQATRYLGLDLFDEYKVMGLAPYGDPERFASAFAEVYQLLPDGTYRFDRARLRRLWTHLPARTPGATFTQADKDVAQAAQLTLQRIVGHVAEHARRATGLDHLCLAGGVALNCCMNGELLRAGRFRDVFVQPAAHDAGLSLGAALHAHHGTETRTAPRSRMRHVYWGGAPGTAQEIESLLRRWEAFVEVEHVDDPYAVTARLLSEGAIVGWMRGRSEFGPRALGNRSILADPRPAENKDIINALVKKREAFRPFAPSVLEEYAAEIFELPEGCGSLPFMLFTVPVREPYRRTLGAITHVDGSARVQTVSQRENPCYWRLIDRFRERTGIPLLLNTSFNNYAEPIVESAADGLMCLLTTGLGVLVLDNWIVRKRPRTRDAWLSLAIGLRAHVKLHDRPVTTAPPDAGASRARGGWWRRLRAHLPIRRTEEMPRSSAAEGRAIGTTSDGRQYLVADEVFDMLLLSDGYRPIGELLDAVGVQHDTARTQCLAAVEELWERRLVSLSPSAA